MSVETIAAADEPRPVPHRVTLTRPTTGRTRSVCAGHDYFSRSPLAKVVRARCVSLHPAGTPVIGGTGCGPCWEYVIRADERIAIEFALPDVDWDEAAAYIDEIAVERACRGEQVTLTRPERKAAIERLARSGYGISAVARLLRMSDTEVRALTPAVFPAGGVR